MTLRKKLLLSVAPLLILIATNAYAQSYGAWYVGVNEDNVMASTTVESEGGLSILAMACYTAGEPCEIALIMPDNCAGAKSRPVMAVYEDGRHEVEHVDTRPAANGSENCVVTLAIDHTKSGLDESIRKDNWVKIATASVDGSYFDVMKFSLRGSSKALARLEQLTRKHRPAAAPAPTSPQPSARKIQM